MRLKLSLIFALSVCATYGETLVHSTAETILNAFIATYAKTQVSWKKDIRTGESPGNLDPGRQLGQSISLGYYSFVPKTWKELSKEEQSLLLGDPRLRAFLISSRGASTYASATDSKPEFPIEGVSLVPSSKQQINENERPPASAIQRLPATSPVEETQPLLQMDPPAQLIVANTTIPAQRPPILIRVAPQALVAGDAINIEVK